MTVVNDRADPVAFLSALLRAGLSLPLLLCAVLAAMTPQRNSNEHASNPQRKCNQPATNRQRRGIQVQRQWRTMTDDERQLMTMMSSPGPGREERTRKVLARPSQDPRPHPPLTRSRSVSPGGRRAAHNHHQAPAHPSAPSP